MIHACHMVGLSNLDQGRLLQPEYHKRIFSHVTERYQSIHREGALLPALSTPSILEKEGRKFPLDHLAGDTRFVFLSVGRRYWLPVDGLNYGFIFDAEDLLQRGAILRTHDLMSNYEEALEEAVTKFAPFLEPSSWPAEQLAALFHSLEDPDAIDASSPTPNDAYYALKEAVEHQRNLDEVWYGHEATAEFLRLVKQVQDRSQLQGQDALDAITQEGESGRFELLFPDRLPLDLVRFWIEEDVSIPNT